MLNFQLKKYLSQSTFPEYGTYEIPDAQDESEDNAVNNWVETHACGQNKQPSEEQQESTIVSGKILIKST